MGARSRRPYRETGHPACGSKRQQDQQEAYSSDLECEACIASAAAAAAVAAAFASALLSLHLLSLHLLSLHLLSLHLLSLHLLSLHLLSLHLLSLHLLSLHLLSLFLLSLFLLLCSTAFIKQIYHFEICHALTQVEPLVDEDGAVVDASMPIYPWIGRTITVRGFLSRVKCMFRGSVRAAFTCQATGTSDGAFSGFLLVGRDTQAASSTELQCTGSTNKAGALHSDALFADPGGRAYPSAYARGRVCRFAHHCNAEDQADNQFRCGRWRGS